MSDFGLVMLFDKYLRIERGWPMPFSRSETAMRTMERKEPGEWFRFLAWAATQKATRKQEKWNEPQ